MKKTSKHNSEPISSALNYLNSGRYVLPSFQRDYVWNMDQIENLFNSIYLGYPFGTMLFWRISLSNKDTNELGKESFYHFPINYHEIKSNQAPKPSPLFPNTDYWVVLDGQQRLTSLNLGLLGSFSQRARYQRKDNPDCPEYKLYMLVSKDSDNPFKFLKTADTRNAEFYIDDKTRERWLLVRTVFYAEKTRDLIKTFGITDESDEDRISTFKHALDNLKIEFTEITGFDYNEAKKIFVRSKGW